MDLAYVLLCVCYEMVGDDECFSVVTCVIPITTKSCNIIA